MVTVTLEELIPRDHPIRVVEEVADEALERLKQ
jgi:transposase